VANSTTGICTEPHCCLKELADLLGLDSSTIKVIFDGEVVLLRLDKPDTERGKARLLGQRTLASLCKIKNSSDKLGSHIPAVLGWMKRHNAVSELPKSYNQSTNISAELHYTPDEVAELWGTCANTIRAIFLHEPEVFIKGTEESLHKRGRKIMRIPQSVMERVHLKYRNKN
jgi:hypothetical protein